MLDGSPISLGVLHFQQRESCPQGPLSNDPKRRCAFVRNPLSAGIPRMSVAIMVKPSLAGR